MEWTEIKKEIIDVLHQRNLADPNIRINALERIEGILVKHFNDYYNDPGLLLQIDKDTFKKQVGQIKSLNSAESSIINNIYQILEGIPLTRYKIARSTSETIVRSKVSKPEIVDSCNELVDPIHGLNPVVDNNTKILILGTFPAKESSDIGFYYQNQVARFWGQALQFIGNFQTLSNPEREKLLIENNIGLWDIFECVEKSIDGNLDSTITRAKLNNLTDLLDKYPSIINIVFNGKNAFDWLGTYKRKLLLNPNLQLVRLQSSSGSNGHFNGAEDWYEYFESIVSNQ